MIVTADGAGSADLSEIGATVAIEAAIDSLVGSEPIGYADLPEALLSAFAAARQRVLDEASTRSMAARDFACTLLVAMLGASGNGFAQIGDGLIAARTGEAPWDWLIWPDNGEYANVTRFLTDEDALSRLRVTCSAERITEIAVMTDGVQPLALDYRSRAVFAPFLDGLLSPLRAAFTELDLQRLAESLGSFLTSERVAERVDDDLTLALAARSPE